MKKTIFISIFSTFISALLPTFCFGQWVQIGNAINGQTAGDRCGNSCAISADGNIVAMGSYNSDASFSNAGQVRVFQNTNGIWTQIGADINGESSGDLTGLSISLSLDGSILAIGEPMNNDLGFTSGQVRVFKNINNNWTQVGQDLYGQNAVASAGTTVDLSADGNTVAFGAPNTTVNPFPSFTGNVEVYQLQGNSWVQKGTDIEGDGTIIKFGQSVSLSADGNTIAIGQTGDPSNISIPQLGRVKVYQFANNQWTQIGSTILGLVDRDEFGFRVSLSASGNILAISTNGSNVVLVYQLDGGVWTQLGNLMVGENLGDGFGSSISLSNSGSRIAIGARRYLGGSSIGRAYVFENQGGNWTLIDNPIVGVANGDQTGFSIAISEDGSKFVVGAINNDSAGSDAGHVRVFENSSLLSVDNVDFEDEVNAIPNPAADFIKIHSKHIITSYNIVSLDGRLIKQKDGLNLSEFPIDIHDLTSGLYILTIQTQGGKSHLKIVKQ